MLYINHATLVTPQTPHHDTAVLIENGRIQAIAPTPQLPAPPGATTLDATNLYLSPGFIDLQLNGAFGKDFTADPNTIWQVAAGLPQYGVTAFLPTIITSPLQVAEQAQAVLQNGRSAHFRGSIPLGLHLEGPFLAPSRKGAHNPAHLRQPSVSDVADWTADHGVSLVTLAPELPGAVDVIRALREQGVVVSAGHSAADFATARTGIAAGICYATHLFNAMSSIHHREPGLIAALLESPQVTIGLIPDGIHVHPALVNMVWQLVGNGRLNLVTDAMSALGMPPATYRLGDFTVTVDDTTARLPDGTLAGSILPLDQAVRNLMNYTGCTLAQALPTVTSTPAALLGLAHRKGQAAVGFDADLVLLNPDYTVAHTIINGEIAYSQAAKTAVFAT